MIYGDTIIYTYDDILPKINTRGETIIENGEIAVEKVEKTIKLRASATMFIHFKNNTGKELIYEYLQMGIKSNKVHNELGEVERLTKQLSEKKVEDITDEEIDEIVNKSQKNIESGNRFTDFFKEIVIAMAMSYSNDRNLTVEEIIKGDLVTDELLRDDKFITEVTALLGFAIKKKYGQLQ